MTGTRAVLRGVRGATTVERDTPEQVRERTQALVRTILERNAIAPDDLVSILFTVTEDIVSAFPATAARELGLEDEPLLGGREAAIEGALPHCIRVLVHCYSELSRKEVQHVYLEGAAVLRSDLAD